MQNYNRTEAKNRLRKNGFDTTNPISGGKHYKYYHKLNRNVYVAVPKHKIINGPMLDGAIKNALASL